MTRKRTDFRALQARRDAALARPELRHEQKPRLDPAAVQAAIAAGKVTRLPDQKRRRT